jgi:hypothetical protein
LGPRGRNGHGPDLPTVCPNLHQRILAIAQELGAIEKTGQADPRMGGYGFIEHAEIMGRLRTLLARHGVTIVPSMHVTGRETVSREGGRVAHRVTVDLTLTVINADRPEDRFTIEWPGEALDTQDKATQKAGTSAEKYALMKLFKISDREDPDGALVGDEPAEAIEPAPRPAPAPSQGASDTLPEGLAREILGERIAKRLSPAEAGRLAAIVGRMAPQVRPTRPELERLVAEHGLEAALAELERLRAEARQRQESAEVERRQETERLRQVRREARDRAWRERQGLPAEPLTPEQRHRLSELVAQLPEPLRPTPQERRHLVAEGFQVAERHLLALVEEAKRDRSTPAAEEVV